MEGTATVTRELVGRTLNITTGHVARQAHGSVTVQYGGTVVLVAAVCAQDFREDIDFLPLTVEYRERTYAAGKIPGGFFKRGGRPGEKEILTARLIDRAIRSQMPKGLRNEIQVHCLVISTDLENNSDILALIGASAALGLSDVPTTNLVGAARIGRIDGQFVVNPTFEQVTRSELDIVVAGSKDAIVMVEGEAEQVSEDLMLEAFRIGHEHIRQTIELQEELIKKAGKPKRELSLKKIEEALDQKVRALAGERVRNAVRTEEKQARMAAVAQTKQAVLEQLKTELGEAEFAPKAKDAAAILEKIEVEAVRTDIAKNGRRPDGRKLTEIRPITAEVHVLPRPHGSAIFTRGQTQALVVTTLGTGADEQLMEQLEREYKKNFMLYYNFPSFSVGEVRPIRSPGRREIGHGMLAERAIAPVIPEKEKFGYTIQVTSDILESNGSSSMASVCGASLSLMDAGVPISAPVAGIAMGLIKHEDTFHVLSDIQGLEDHFGDMDFKVAGTAKGITAIQMDIKITGLSHELMKRALEQAREGRLHILGIMNATISQPSAELSEFAPRIESIMINPDNIRDIIGPGGKMIKKITEETGTQIEIEDSGKVSVAARDPKAMQAAFDWIRRLAPNVEVGQVYQGVVKKIMEFGAFVEIVPNRDGLVHISQLADYRVKKVEDVVKEGDILEVKVIEIDANGKIRLSHKDVMKENKPE
ncbi:MAG: polyribonucleotide nucleotidyltransferase [Candidatus Firestonebacteria bacterium]|nr:polyribonucleotide nucleotidyltransferase [Candidatus Firestonebacteria bacterium]